MTGSSLEILNFGIVFVVQMKKRTMKNLSILFGLLIILTFSCEEKVGPQGPEGPAGAAGENAHLFEYSNVDFAAPEYDVVLAYPDDFEGRESDVALVYLLWEVTTDNDGNNLEIWRQMPQTVYTENGQIQYNFDFTMFDTRLFLTTEFDPTLLEPIDTDDWIVRVVIVPGNFWGARTALDHSDYNAVKEAYGLPELNPHKLTKRR
jgi:hypothetical protein